MKTDEIRRLLDGLESRIAGRKTKRRQHQVEHLERKRKGQTREYYIDKEKRA